VARPRQHKQRRREGNPLGARPVPGTQRADVWEYLEDLRVHQRTPDAVGGQAKALQAWLRWCDDRALLRARDVTRPIVERYQRHLFYARKKDGRPLAATTQYGHLVIVRNFFRWLTRGGFLLANPASELLLPKLPQRLPQAILSPEEAEGVLAQPDVSTVAGLRDRAMLEVLYSSGLRRMELAALRLFDVNASHGTVWVRQGKGRKDRVVPIGERALAWVLKYADDVRPKLAGAHDEGVLFLGDAGEPLHVDYLSQLARAYLMAAGIRKPGACHLFRHSMATAMLEGGADVRFVQEMLGHSSLETTQLYTRVSIEKLKAVHAATHPAARLLRGAAASEVEAAKAEQRQVVAEVHASLAVEAEEEL